MKLTDMAIVFQFFLICLITVLHVKSAGIHAETVNEIMYNNVMDGIVEDSLRAGYKCIDGRGLPVVDLSEVRKCFVAEKEIYNSADKHILIYADKDCFYVWDSEKTWEWSAEIPFQYEEDTEHEQKSYQIMNYIEDNYDIIISLPYNTGETFLNTVEDYSLVALSFNRNWEINCFSAAKIHRVK